MFFSSASPKRNHSHTRSSMMRIERPVLLEHDDTHDAEPGGAILFGCVISSLFHLYLSHAKRVCLRVNLSRSVRLTRITEPCLKVGSSPRSVHRLTVSLLTFNIWATCSRLKASGATLGAMSLIRSCSSSSRRSIAAWMSATQNASGNSLRSGVSKASAILVRQPGKTRIRPRSIWLRSDT